jgi:hypothetical protein
MNANNFLSFKTCEFNFFTNFFLDYSNLAVNDEQLIFQDFFLNSKWPKNSIWQIFCTKIDFLVAEPLNEMFEFLDMLPYF